MKVKWRSKVVHFDPPPVKSFKPIPDGLYFAEVGLEYLYAKEAKRVMGRGATVEETQAHLAMYRPQAPDKLAKLKRKPWKDLTEAEKQAIREGEK